MYLRSLFDFLRRRCDSIDEYARIFFGVWVLRNVAKNKALGITRELFLDYSFSRESEVLFWIYRIIDQLNSKNACVHVYFVNALSVAKWKYIMIRKQGQVCLKIRESFVIKQLLVFELRFSSF